MLHCQEGFIIAILTITQFFAAAAIALYPRDRKFSRLYKSFSQADKQCLFLESHEFFQTLGLISRL